MADKDFDKAFARYQRDVIDVYQDVDIRKSEAVLDRTFLNFDTNHTVRSDWNRSDYEYFRNTERVPTKASDIIRMCMEAYDQVGIVRNVIDLMGDFASGGIRIVHPNKKIEKFYQNWFSHVGGKDRTERFLNTLFKAGNVIIQRVEGKVSLKNQKKWKAVAEEDVENEIIRRGMIPTRYIFHSPLSVIAIGENVANYLGRPFYALRASRALTSQIKSIQQSGNKDVSSQFLKKRIDNLPSDIRQALKNGGIIPLNQESLSVYHYKKDDWNVWAKPMTYAILSELIMLHKTEMADTAALDGTIANVRLWQLGDLDKGIAPTRAGINKLRNILHKSTGGGVIDLVWGPELTFTETNTQIHNFLGKDKYEAILTLIYAGLGVPPTLTGSSNSSGMTNNSISMRTLVERLEYGRALVEDFWNKEIARVQRAMGFRLPAQVEFTYSVLADEAAEKNLLIQLADRNIISDEAVTQAFGKKSTIEKAKVNRENRSRGRTSPHKSSPYHTPQIEHELRKIFATRGTVAPSEIGLTLDKKKVGEKNFLEWMNEGKVQQAGGPPKSKDSKVKDAKVVGRPEDGRPKNSKDQKPRKTRVDKPRTAALNTLVWYSDAQEKISDIMIPALLTAFRKKNLRQLTKQEFGQAEKMKFDVLSCLTPDSDIDEDLVAGYLECGKVVSTEVLMYYEHVLSEFIEKNKRKPNTKECRQLECVAITLNYEEEKNA